MKNLSKKERSNFVDVLLLTAIFATLFTIIYFTLIDKRFTFAKPQNTPDITDMSPASETTESESTFPGVKIITDTSNDPFIPFAIQYPLTLHEAFNNQIEAYIEIEKNKYISQMQEKKGKFDNKQVGELNISFETYSYIDAYYSFILTRTLSLPGQEKIQTVNTYFLNNKTGDLLTLRDILSNNDKNLHTFSEQLQKLMQDNESFAMLGTEQINNMAAPSWGNFEYFTISEDNLILFMHPIEDIPAAQPVTLEVSLSSINTLLNEEFQIQMEEVQVTVDPNSGSGKRIALTFDDGPHPDVTPQILAILEKYNAKATFFMLGSRVQYYPDIARDVFKRGHEIGNHTWNHPVLTKLSDAEILKEYITTEQAIVAATGTNSTIFRPPYGASNSRVKAVINSPQINWSIDTLDWKFRSAPKLLPAITSTLHNNAIILMHDIHLSTAEGLEDVLQYLQGQGYEFVTVSEILNDKE